MKTLAATDHKRPEDNMIVGFHMTQDPISSEDAIPALGTTSGGMGVAMPVLFEDNRRDGVRLHDGVSATLQAHMGTGGNNTPMVAFSENQRGELLETEISHQLTTGGGKPGQGYPAVREGVTVRRLTPLECERLQGFPDGWTEDQTDSARYRQLGNAVAVPCVEWIAKRLVEVDQKAKVTA